METLTRALYRIIGKHGQSCYKSLIDDYYKGDWNFNIKSLVSYQTIKQKTDFLPRGYRFIRTRIVTDTKQFETEILKYYNLHYLPVREVRKKRIEYKKIYLKLFGYITEGNQFCQDANYRCDKCLNSKACNIAKKYTNNSLELKRKTKILSLLYGNLRGTLPNLQVKEGLKYL